MVCEPRGGGGYDCVQQRCEGFVFTKAAARMRNKQKTIMTRDARRRRRRRRRVSPAWCGRWPSWCLEDEEEVEVGGCEDDVAEGGRLFPFQAARKTDAGAVQTEQLAAKLCDFCMENPKPEAEEFNENTTKQKTT